LWGRGSHAVGGVNKNGSKGKNFQGTVRRRVGNEGGGGKPPSNLSKKRINGEKQGKGAPGSNS